jgi:hypothetical protein
LSLGLFSGSSSESGSLARLRMRSSSRLIAQREARYLRAKRASACRRAHDTLLYICSSDSLKNSARHQRRAQAAGGQADAPGRPPAAAERTRRCRPPAYVGSPAIRSTLRAWDFIDPTTAPSREIDLVSPRGNLRFPIATRTSSFRSRPPETARATRRLAHTVRRSSASLRERGTPARAHDSGRRRWVSLRCGPPGRGRCLPAMVAEE